MLWFNTLLTLFFNIEGLFILLFLLFFRYKIDYLGGSFLINFSLNLTFLKEVSEFN